MERVTNKNLAKEVAAIIAASAAAPILIPGVALAQEQPAQVEQCSIKIESYNPTPNTNQISIRRNIPCNSLEDTVYSLGNSIPEVPKTTQQTEQSIPEQLKYFGIGFFGASALLALGYCVITVLGGMITYKDPR